jgi:tetratricopeptide (TPR) repeat protein
MTEPQTSPLKAHKAVPCPSAGALGSQVQRLWNNAWVRSALLFALLLLVYWPALRGGFVWDDALLIDQNPVIKGKAGLGSVWLHSDFPLTMSAIWLQWSLWGKNPAGYHVVNVLLHGIGCLLIWRVLWRLKIPGAWLAAALFAVHPVCVGSAAWISELKNTLSLPLFLLSILCYLNSESAGTGGKNTTLWYGLSLGTFLLALLSKTSTVMLPVVLLAIAWWQRGKITPQDGKRTLPFFLLALAFGLMSIRFQAEVMTGQTVQTENFFGRLAGAGMAIWFYLGKTLLPLSLNLIYPRWTINAAAPLAYLPLAFLLAAFAVCWHFRRSWGRGPLFALGCFAITLFPVLGFFDMYYLAISRVSDHLQYLPMVALIGLVAAWLSSTFHGKALGIVCATWIAALSILSWNRARVFSSDESLWRDTLSKNRASWSAHNNMGCILAEKGEIADAIKEFKASLQINSRNASAHRNLGRALALQNELPQAEYHLRTALEIKLRDADAHRTYGSVLAQLGRNDEAIKQLTEANRLDPDAETSSQLAGLFQQEGKVRETIEQYRKALALNPNALEALNNLAWLLSTSADGTLRNGAEAVQLAERANRLTGGSQPVLLGTLAAAYAEAGRFGDAVAMAEKTVRLATAAGNAQFANINRRLLEVYRAGKPWHEPPHPP